jgi:hypothetical protein
MIFTHQIQDPSFIILPNIAALSHGNLHPLRYSLMAVVLRTAIKEMCCIVRAIKCRRMQWAGYMACI